MNRPPFYRRHFQIDLLDWKLFHLDSNFAEGRTRPLSKQMVAQFTDVFMCYSASID